MKIICDKYLLCDALSGVSRAVSSKSAIPILEGILIKATPGQIMLTGYDLEIGITTIIEAKVLEEGDIVLSSKLLGDMVRRLDSEEVTIESLENMATTIKGGITEFNIMGMNSSEFPEIPSTGADPAITINSKTLKNMIDCTIYAVSMDDKKPAHTGELFVLEKDKLTLVALDGFRLAICERPVVSTREIRIVIPQKTMQEISRLIVDEDADIEICANRRYVVVTIGEYTVLSRLIEGDFLDFQRVVPQEFSTRVIIDTKDFIESIERASLIITERLKEPLRITFGKNVLIRCQTALGKVSDELDAEIQGNSLEIGFNNRYLLDALRNAKCEKIVMEMTGALSPVKILPIEGNDFIYLVLPVRFKND
ncbi:MAG: DNA polymerase III subunit beta [Oscillospiraceae bacterium]